MIKKSRFGQLLLKKEVIDRISDFFHFMDDKYYSELEGRPDDMRELVEFLDKKEI